MTRPSDGIFSPGRTTTTSPTTRLATGTVRSRPSSSLVAEVEPRFSRAFSALAEAVRARASAYRPARRNTVTRAATEVDLVRAGGRCAEEREAHRHAGHARAAEEQGVERPAERGDDAEADERVHGDGAMAGVDRRRAVERPRAPHRDGGRQGEREPLPIRELQRRDHGQHCDRHGQCEADEQPAAEGVGLGIGRDLLRDGRRGPRGRVARSLDDRDEVRRVEVVAAHARLLGGVVDGCLDAGQLVQLALDPGGARGARHPGDVELDVGGAHDGSAARA